MFYWEEDRTFLREMFDKQLSLECDIRDLFEKQTKIYIALTEIQARQQIIINHLIHVDKQLERSLNEKK